VIDAEHNRRILEANTDAEQYAAWAHKVAIKRRLEKLDGAALARAVERALEELVAPERSA